MEKIINILKKNEEIVIRYLPKIQDLNIQVIFDKSLTIPEIGIGGAYKKSENKIKIYIDTNHKNIQQNLEKELLKTLAHEYLHATREQNIPWEGCTLLEALVAEGLAQNFEMQISGEKPIYADALSDTEIQSVFKKISPMLYRTNFDYGELFFGVGGIYKKWAGYSIGFWLVKEYLSETHKQPTQLIFEDAKNFLFMPEKIQ